MKHLFGYLAKTWALVLLPIPVLAEPLSITNPPVHQILLPSLGSFRRITNFSAAVDVDTVDRHSTTALTTRTKETWTFCRTGGTNSFIRSRFAPISGREVIEATNYFGGRLLAGSSSVVLPADVSLPGFEALILLADMFAANPLVEAREGGSLILAAKTAAGFTIKAWFAEGNTAPSRIEKYKNSTLVFVLTRQDAGGADSVLPLRDALHFYENGRVTMTVIRSFSNFRELPERPPGASAPPSQK